MPKGDYWDQGWNVVSGCTPDYECWKLCYARRMARRLAGRYGYPEAPHHFDVTLHPERLQEPLKWRKPRRVLLASMGVWIHPDVPLGFIDQVLEVIAACPQHTFLSLTKRADTMEHQLYGYNETCQIRELGGGDYLPNLWLGVSVSRPADLWRVEELLRIPAAVRWVSAEPLLEKINLRPYLLSGAHKWKHDISWIVAGPENGPGARPTHLDVFRSVKQQCQDYEVPFWFKSGELDGETWHQLPETERLI